MPRSELVQSLLRGLDLLKIISSSPEGMRLNELCAVTGLKKSTVHNLMRTLCFRNFAYKDHQHRFKIGAAAAEISENSAGKERMVKARRIFQTLAKKFPRSVITFSVLTQGEVRCLLRVTPENPGVVQQPSSRCFMPYSSSSAILLQAMHPRECISLEQQYPFEEYGAGLWGSEENFSAAKEKVVAEGFCRRFSNNTTIMAFPLPELHVLGFNTPASCENDLAEYISTVDEFKKLLWDNKKDEK